MVLIQRRQHVVPHNAAHTLDREIDGPRDDDEKRERGREGERDRQTGEGGREGGRERQQQSADTRESPLYPEGIGP